MAEGAPLLRAYGLIAHRGFESLSLRHISKAPHGAFDICGAGRLDESPLVRAERRRRETTSASAGGPEGVRAAGPSNPSLFANFSTST